MRTILAKCCSDSSSTPCSAEGHQDHHGGGSSQSSKHMHKVFVVSMFSVPSVKTKAKWLVGWTYAPSPHTAGDRPWKKTSGSVNSSRPDLAQKTISRGERTSDMIPERRYWRLGWGQSTAPLIMTPGHSQTMQRQQEPPETCSSKTRSRHPTCWNIQIYRFRDFACNYCSLILQSMNQLYRPYKYNETRRKAPGQHLTKLSQNPSLGKAFCVDVPKKPAKQGCKNVGVWATNSLIDSLCIIL